MSKINNPSELVKSFEGKTELSDEDRATLDDAIFSYYHATIQWLNPKYCDALKALIGIRGWTMAETMLDKAHVYACSKSCESYLIHKKYGVPFSESQYVPLMNALHSVLKFHLRSMPESLVKIRKDVALYNEWRHEETFKAVMNLTRTKRPIWSYLVW